MDVNEFNRLLAQKSAEVQQAIKTEVTRDITAAGLRFIDDNFRNQGWDGQAWPKSKENGTTLVDSGELRRGFNTEVREDGVRYYNEVPYGKAHNEGFEETVTVKEHTRSSYARNGQNRTRSTAKTVKSHSRKMKIAKRQFAPYEGHESQTLNTQVTTIIQNKITEILNL